MSNIAFNDPNGSAGPHNRRVFELEMRVRDYEVDSQGIVNNAVYLHYMEHTRHEFCREAGFTFAGMQSRGIDPVLRRVEVDYLHSLGLGDTMLSRLWLQRRGARFVFNQEIYRLPEMTPVAKGVCTIVCLENGRITRGDVLAETFEPWLCGDNTEHQ